MSEHFSPEEVQRAVRETREHYQAHGAEACARCDLWRAYVDRDVAGLDRLTKQFEIDDEFQAIIEKLRTDWGEGTWTDKESE